MMPDDDAWDKIPDKLVEQLAMTVGFRVRETKKHVLVVHTLMREYKDACKSLKG